MTNKVLAKVNGREITENDFNLFFQTLGQQVQGQFQGEQGRERLLDELIYQELFYAEALETNLGDDEGFKEELNRVSENLLKQYNIKQLIESVRVSDEESEAFYKENPQYFQTGAQVKASHILVDTEEEAAKLKSEIEAGATFEDVAKASSKCPSNEKGGDLGFFQKGQMVPEFEEVAFTIDREVVSEPVKTQFGYHLIYKTDEKAAETQSYEAVKDQIAHQLLIQKQNSAYLTKVEDLKSKYTVERL